MNAIGIIIIIVLLVKNTIKDDYSALNKEIESSHEKSKFTFYDRVRITKYNYIFSKSYTENWSREMFVINSMLKNSSMNG